MDFNRIKDNVKVDGNGCWIWQLYCDPQGYGYLSYRRKTYRAHRYAYRCVYNDLKDHDLVRHMCHNPSCCNPDHLKKVHTKIIITIV